MKEREARPCQVASIAGENRIFGINYGKDEKKEFPTLLLHSCCGPCSTSVIDSLADEFKITVFYYNPNITDRDEYLKRREAQLKAIEKLNEIAVEKGRHEISFLDGDYEIEKYYEVCKGLEDEPEGGARCKECFVLRLEKTCQEAKMGAYTAFGTTLSVSPHKNYKLLSEIGNRLSLRYGIDFLDRDFKKKDGYLRSIKLSKDFELYRQNYCGCEFSKWFEK